MAEGQQKRRDRSYLGGGVGSVLGQEAGRWVAAASRPPHSPPDVFMYVGGVCGCVLGYGAWALGEALLGRWARRRGVPEPVPEDKVWPPAPERPEGR